MPLEDYLRTGNYLFNRDFHDHQNFIIIFFSGWILMRVGDDKELGLKNEIAYII